MEKHPKICSLMSHFMEYSHEQQQQLVQHNHPVFNDIWQLKINPDVYHKLSQLKSNISILKNNAFKSNYVIITRLKKVNIQL